MSDGVTETDAQRIARLEGELRASGRVNYLLQEAGARVVWNNDHLRAAMSAVIAGIGETAETPALATIRARLAKAIADTLSKSMATDKPHDC